MAIGTFENDNDIAASGGRSMRIFIFKSDKNVELRAFGGDLAGTQLPSQFRPWHVVGAVAPDQDPPYNLSRQVIETAINGQGFQLFRLGKKA